MIITAASEAFGPSLLALLGSLNLNWPNHPPVLVYDIGLDSTTLGKLESERISVRKVPSFCRHWRHHFTWKIWCLNDAPAHNILWMDAGLVVLRPLDEIPEAINIQGYFFTTNYELLDWEASEEACEGCEVSVDFRTGKPALAGTLMGFSKKGLGLRLIDSAMKVGLVEKYIKATDFAHRHDQAIISLLAYRYLERILIADGGLYLGSLSPKQIPGQKIWVHRRSMLKRDLEHLAAHLMGPGDPFTPSEPYPLRRAEALSHLYKVYWCYGRKDCELAKEHLERAFGIDPTLENDIGLLVNRLQMSCRGLISFFNNEAIGQRFSLWILEQLKIMRGEPFVAKLADSMSDWLRRQYGA